jgi:hypothetical protein
MDTYPEYQQWIIAMFIEPKPDSNEPVYQSFQLPDTPVPDGCGEVIELILKTFKTELQWSYLRIFIQLYEPE